MLPILDILMFSCAARFDDPKVITQGNLCLANNLVFNVAQTALDNTDILQEEQKMWVVE